MKWKFKHCFLIDFKDEDVVKLYDLSSLCDQNLIFEDDTSENNKNPFKDGVAMLLYKIARNIMHKKRTRDIKLKHDRLTGYGKIDFFVNIENDT